MTPDQWAQVFSAGSRALDVPYQLQPGEALARALAAMARVSREIAAED